MNVVLDETTIPAVTFTVDRLALVERRHFALNDRDLRTWLISSGLARTNGSAGVLELTELGAEAAAGVRDLQAWIRS